MNSKRPVNDILTPDLPTITGEHRTMLGRIRIVLVEPQHAGNIGSVARAMNVCGITDLWLVNPKPWRESDEPWTLGYASREILDNAREVASVDEAIDGATVIIGTTHRVGRARGPLVTPRTMASEIPGIVANGNVAILFGREDFGLPNDLLERCHMGVHVPTAVDYPSLNLSQAVMVIVYEAFQGIITADYANDLRKRPSYDAVLALAERVATLAEHSGYDHPRGHVGLVRSLRLSIRESDVSLRETQLIHILCKRLERYIANLEKGLDPDTARGAPSE